MEIRFIEFLSSTRKGDHEAIFTSGSFTHRQGAPLLLFMRLEGPVDGTELIVVVVRVVVVLVIVAAAVIVVVVVLLKGGGGGTRGNVEEVLHHKQSTEEFQI